MQSFLVVKRMSFHISGQTQGGWFVRGASVNSAWTNCKTICKFPNFSLVHWKMETSVTQLSSPFHFVYNKGETRMRSTPLIHWCTWSTQSFTPMVNKALLLLSKINILKILWNLFHLSFWNKEDYFHLRFSSKELHQPKFNAVNPQSSNRVATGSCD